jgi:aerobic carbon-monoxide dehydrogenase medium subunit
MIPAGFEYARAGSVDEAIALLGRDEDAKLLAGGHSLIPLMRLRFTRPSLLVDIGRLDDLRYVRDDGDRIAIGALTRHAELVRDRLLAQHCALIGEAAAGIGDPQVRHRGTIGGSIAHGDPASDLGTIVLTLDAELVARGPGGERTIPAADFFAGMFETALARQEVLTEIRVPKVPAGTYLKVERRAQDWATVAVAAARVDGRVQVGLTSMGPTPLRARSVEEAFAGGASPADAAAHTADGTSPPSDVSGSGEYRAHLAQVLVRRALEQL